MPRILASEHPLIADQLARLRDASTPPMEFRGLVRSMARLLAFEASADLPTEPTEVRTPLAPAAARRLASEVALVPILRAGLGMVDGLLDVLPSASVWHLGIFRDESTLQPVTYYKRLPGSSTRAVAYLLDPMLATGGSAVRGCDLLREAGVGTIKLISLIAAPEGVERLAAAHPDVPIHVAAVDQRLNEVGYIVPGLGDAGDRQFGT
jgi:uracil phosphoribosyltransferase